MSKDSKFDAAVIGSGFGGSMVASALISAGWKVIMVERGDWVERGSHNWDAKSSVDLTKHYDHETAYRIVQGGNKKYMGLYSNVGGPSVFYGGVSFRFREEDFTPPEEIIMNSGAAWPISYKDFEPFYCSAEEILNVSGRANLDPTEPWRSRGYPQPPFPLSNISSRLDSAARELDLNPFNLPLAINYSENDHRKACIACTTCDTFACAISAKNDLATILIPQLIDQGLKLQTNTLLTKMEFDKARISRICCFDKSADKEVVYSPRLVILSSGAIASPHLVLASGLESQNPGGKHIGRYLMRHVNAIVFGIFPSPPDREKTFHKQLGIHDYYFGHPSVDPPLKKIGSMQQVQSPPAGLVENELPGFIGKMVSPAVRLLTGLLVIAEDQPNFENQVALNPSKKDRFGLPELTISHKYSSRDLTAIDVLKKKAKSILRNVGAVAFYVHDIRTFSHAVGTLRFGEDPENSVLDPFCKFRGVDNLYVVDGSFMPTSAGLNPSLTIAANALRVGQHLCDTN